MKISSIQDLKKLSISVKKRLSPGDSIFLYGEIGVGKTSFARLLINQYEIENKQVISEILSPTFNIVFEYEIKNITIKHYDLYRLNRESDIKNLGLFEDQKTNITLIEWPELISKKPKNRIDMFFKYTKDMNERVLSVKSYGRIKFNEF